MASLKLGNEKEPPAKVSIDYRPKDSIAHNVVDGETWQSLADRYGVDVKYLIWINFKTLDSKEINWYLHHYVCCDTPAADRYNWKFTASAQKYKTKSPRAGVIYIPPREITFEDEVIVVEIDRLVFDGRALKWMLGAKTVKSWPAVSGRSGYQSKDHQNLRDKGPIPQGSYDVRQSEYQKMPDRGVFEQIAGELGRTAWPGGESSWGKHRIWLHPRDGTNTYGRSGFSIHGGDDPGSAGCVDLTTHISDFVSKFRSHGKDLILWVQY